MSIAQPPPTKYPEGYFRNPLNIPINLSGNFGELRPNHYHMGLDLKTNARENLPIYAAADGYISRIKIEPGGFGRALYISHPNGYTTLYAHMNDFNRNIEAFLKRRQYEEEKWHIQLELPENVLPVKKGDFIGYSGNTGGSQAPHLHFEIRRTEDDVNLNPSLFGFQIPDQVKPRLLRVGIYDRTKSVYQQSPKLYSLKSTGSGRYSTSPALIKVSSPRVSFGFTGYDTHTGSSNLNGVFSATLEVDGKPVAGFTMDEISYNDTRFLNAHIDYRLKQTSGIYLQHLSELPGYINSIYWKQEGNGVLDISDEAVHNIRIIVKDANTNTSTIEYSVQYNGAEQTSNPGPGKMFYPMMLDVFESPDCEFIVGEQCLYDSVQLNYRSSPASAPTAVSSIHSIGASYIPLQDSILVRIRPSRVLTEDEKERTVMQWYAGSKKSVQKVEWQGDWASASFRDLGFFQLLLDTEPPVIIPSGFTDGSDLSKSSRIVFTVKDNLEKFKNVRAEVDGRWIRFSNDKGRTFIYRFDEKVLAGNHELMVRAEDEAGNITEKVYRFKR